MTSSLGAWPPVRFWGHPRSALPLVLGELGELAAPVNVSLFHSLASKFQGYGVQAEHIADWLRRSGGSLVTLRHPGEDLVLFMLGDSRILEVPSVALVGTRGASGFGLQAAARFGRDLSRSGVTTVSGLARGVDTAAHEGSLLVGGPTVAVLAHGLDRIYPSENRDLAQKILSRGGLLVSEYPPGVPPLKHHFPARNRIIAAVSRGVCVIEAPKKSGALISAQQALEIGREVWVVPGRYDDPNFAGSHLWIEDGAHPVFSARTILNDLSVTKSFQEEPDPHLHKSLRSIFRREVAGLSELVRESRRSLSEIAQLVELGIRRQWILERPGGYYLWLGPESEVPSLLM